MDISEEDKNKLLSSIYKTSQKILHPLTNYIKSNMENSDEFIKSIYQSLKMSPPTAQDLANFESTKIDHSKIPKALRYNRGFN